MNGDEYRRRQTPNVQTFLPKMFLLSKFSHFSKIISKFRAHFDKLFYKSVVINLFTLTYP
jgi:hypothetical protein